MDRDFIKSLIEKKYLGDLLSALEEDLVKKAFADDYMFCLEMTDEYFAKIGLDDPVSDFEKDKKAFIHKEIMRKIDEQSFEED